MKTRYKIILVITIVITIIMSMVTTASAAQVSSLVNQAEFKDRTNVNEIDISIGRTDETIPNKLITIRPQTSFYLSATATGKYTKYTPIGIQTTSTATPIDFYGIMQNDTINVNPNNTAERTAQITRKYWLHGANEESKGKEINWITIKSGETYAMADKDDETNSIGNVPYFTLNISVDAEYAQMTVYQTTRVLYEVLNEDGKAYTTREYTDTRWKIIQATDQIQAVDVAPQIRGIYSYEGKNFNPLKIISMETQISIEPADATQFDPTVYLDSVFITSVFGTTNDIKAIYNRDLPELGTEIKEVVVSPEMDFTTWIVEAVGGFMNMEIYPGLSTGAIFATVGGLALLMMVLKMIAGG